MLNKRGQGLSTKAIVLIVLGVTILVFLVFGFTVGWEKFIPFLGGSDNVGTIATSCKVACSISDEDSFCSKERELRANDLTLTGSCLDFSTNPSYEKYGVEKCLGLCRNLGSSSVSSGGSSHTEIDFNQKGTWSYSQGSQKYYVNPVYEGAEDAAFGCNDFSVYCTDNLVVSNSDCLLNDMIVKYKDPKGGVLEKSCREVISGA